MLNSKMIQNYSSSLFSILDDNSMRRRALDQLIVFLKEMNASKTFYDLMTVPIIDHSKKTKIVDLVSNKYHFDIISKNFLYSLVKNSRISLLPDLIDNMQKLLENEDNVQTVEITSAFELSKNDEDKIKVFLSEKLKKQVRLKTYVDSSLIGGVLIKYGSNLIDTSVSGILKEIGKISI